MEVQIGPLDKAYSQKTHTYVCPKNKDRLATLRRKLPVKLNSEVLIFEILKMNIL